MISRHVKTLFVGAVALIGTYANVGAGTPGCEEELAYYALHGTPSAHLYARLTGRVRADLPWIGSGCALST